MRWAPLFPRSGDGGDVLTAGATKYGGGLKSDQMKRPKDLDRERPAREGGVRSDPGQTDP